MEYQIIKDNLSNFDGAEFVCSFPSLGQAKRYVESVAALGVNRDYVFYIYCYKCRVYKHMYKFLPNRQFERL